MYAPKSVSRTTSHTHTQFALNISPHLQACNARTQYIRADVIIFCIESIYFGNFVTGCVCVFEYDVFIVWFGNDSQNVILLYLLLDPLACSQFGSRENRNFMCTAQDYIHLFRSAWSEDEDFSVSDNVIYGIHALSLERCNNNTHGTRLSTTHTSHTASHLIVLKLFFDVAILHISEFRTYSIWCSWFAFSSHLLPFSTWPASDGNIRTPKFAEYYDKRRIHFFSCQISPLWTCIWIPLRNRRNYKYVFLQIYESRKERDGVR